MYFLIIWLRNDIKINSILFERWPKQAIAETHLTRYVAVFIRATSFNSSKNEHYNNNNNNKQLT